MEHQHLESLYPKDSRFPEIEQILSFVKEGNSCQMIAMPGVGRGNVCKFLAYNHNIRVKHLGEKQTSYHFVFVNFAEVKKRPLGDIIKFIFLQLVSSLHERKMDKAFISVDAMFKESLKYKDELVLFEGLKKAIDFLVHEQQLHIILLFERFEWYLPQLTDEFFINLRSLRDRAKYKFSVVFSVTRLLEDTVESTIMSDFYEFFGGHQVYLTLCDNPGIAFRMQYLEEVTGKKLPEKLKQHLLKLTGGHGKLTRLGMETLLATNSQQLTSTISEKDLDKLLFEQKTVKTTLKEIWDFLTPEEQQLVQQVGIERNIESKEYEENRFLEQIGLIKNQTITIPLLIDLIRLYEKEPYPTNDQIFYDPGTNTIKKGNLTLSEQLTAFEFRLLQFLIENKGKVLEREAIIQAVWKEQASTIGVTDQALDQLIFRLRKKIEPNPNNPIHIQTVKGRGILFVL